MMFAIALLASMSCTWAQTRFPWPAGKRVAVSLSFDDARASQVTAGLDVFEKHGAKVTFFVNPRSVEKQMEGWKRAVRLGHEIGNHSTSHPCSGNFSWSRKNALEDYTMQRMESDFAAASKEIERLLGVKAATSAYPCGSKFVGRAEQTQSYVPLMAKMFIAARGFRDEAANDPAYCDFSQLLGVESDGMSFEQMRDAVRKAEGEGGWLVLAGHEIGGKGNQTTEIATLEKFLAYAADPANGVWLERVDTVARYIRQHRPARVAAGRSAEGGSVPVARVAE